MCFCLATGGRLEWQHYECSVESRDRSDLQFALDVMEENSHLGLDDEGASQLKSILRHIEEANRPTVRNETRESEVHDYTSRLQLLRCAESQCEGHRFE